MRVQSAIIYAAKTPLTPEHIAVAVGGFVIYLRTVVVDGDVNAAYSLAKPRPLEEFMGTMALVEDRSQG